eukprot:3944772-Lingulodinium_polyedra.AAC.1
MLFLPGGKFEFWKVVYAVQQPHYLGVCKLTERDASGSGDHSWAPNDLATVMRARFRFWCNYAKLDTVL